MEVVCPDLGRSSFLKESQIMESSLKEIAELLRTISNVLQEIKVDLDQKQKPLAERRLWTKQEVMEKVKMTEPTYNRNLKREILNPMRLSGSDLYFEEDLVKALEESRRKGRI